MSRVDYSNWDDDDTDSESENIAPSKQASAPAAAHPASTTAPTASACDTILAVKLPCMGEGGKTWHEIHIPTNHPVFQDAELPIPKLIDIPLVIHRLGTQSPDRGDLDCPIATMLNVDSRTGCAPPAWQVNVGSCIVARKDKKPLSSEHLEAVWMYIEALMDDFGEEGYSAAKKRYSREAFENWYENYKEECVSMERDEWQNAKSPYDV